MGASHRFLAGRVAGGLCLVLFCFSAGLASGADVITLVPGTTFKSAIGGRVNGQIQSESPTEVTVQVGTNSITVPNELIQSIRYEGQTANYQIAETRESANMLTEAAELYKKAAVESTARPLAHQSALFHEAKVLSELAVSEPDRLADAKAALAKFIKDYPAGRQIIAAREALFRLQLSAGDLAGAKATIADLSRIPKSAERAAVLETKLLAKEGKYTEAVTELDRLIAAAPKGSARLRAAQLAKAESLAGMKQYKEAETLVREVIQANPAEDAASQAPAYNTLGDCLRAANKRRDALRAYLHTDLLYSKEKLEHAKALYQISLLFRQLNEDGRADEYTQRLKQEYPRSAWASAKPAAAE